MILSKIIFSDEIYEIKISLSNCDKFIHLFYLSYEPLEVFDFIFSL